MKKKAIVIAAVAVVLIAAIFLIFRDQPFNQQFRETTAGLTSYLLEGDMEITKGEDIKSYALSVKYLKEQEPVSYTHLSLSYELYVCLIPFLWMLGWVLLPVASCLVQPIERILQERYVQDARIRLDTCPQLLCIGISGSYGKTSVKHIAYALLKDSYYTLMTPHSYNNRMGITRTIREQLDPLHEVFLCEMGSDHSGELKEPVSYTHLDVYKRQVAGWRY